LTVVPRFVTVRGPRPATISHIMTCGLLLLLGRGEAR
jgi:hypothetical protein